MTLGALQGKGDFELGTTPSGGGPSLVPELFLADRAEDRESIYRLRYRAYRSVGAIPRRADRRFEDDDDERPGSYLFGLREPDGRVSSSLRVLVSENARQVTSRRAFSDVLDARVVPGEWVAEANRFVVDPGLASRRRGRARQLLLFRALVLCCQVFDVDWYLGAARPRHVPFYRRLVLLSPWSDPRVYPGLSTPMVLLGGRFRRNLRLFQERRGESLAWTQPDLRSWSARLAAERP